MKFVPTLDGILLNVDQIGYLEPTTQRAGTYDARTDMHDFLGTIELKVVRKLIEWADVDLEPLIRKRNRMAAAA